MNPRFSLPALKDEALEVQRFMKISGTLRKAGPLRVELLACVLESLGFAACQDLMGQ